MVHHSIAVVITSFLTNFSERRKGEVRRIYLPRTPVDSVQVRGMKKGWCFGRISKARRTGDVSPHYSRSSASLMNKGECDFERRESMCGLLAAFPTC